MVIKLRPSERLHKLFRPCQPPEQMTERRRTGAVDEEQEEGGDEDEDGEPEEEKERGGRGERGRKMNAEAQADKSA